MGGPQSPIRFVLSNPFNSRIKILGHANGILRIFSIETLKIESTYQLNLQDEKEEVTAAVYNPNGVNFSIGTSYGNIYFGSIKEESQSKIRILVGRLENVGKG